MRTHLSFAAPPGRLDDSAGGRPRRKRLDDKISLTLLLAGRLREPASDLLGLADDDLDLVAGEGLVRIISGVRVVGPCCQHGDVVDLCIYQNFTIIDLNAIDAT